MNILILTTIFPPKYSGALIQMVTLAKELRQKGYNIEFVADNYNEKTTDDSFEGFAVHRFCTYFELTTSRTNKLQEFIYAVKVLVFILKNPKYQAIFSLSMGGVISLIFPILKMLNKKIILRLSLVNADDPLTMKRRKLGFLFYPAICCVDKIIAISSKLFDLTKEAGIDPKRIELIPNGVDTAKFYKLSGHDKNELKESMGYGQYSHIFLAVGQVEERKGYEFMVRAWKFINEACPDSILLIIGPGNNNENVYYQKIKKIIDENLIKNIEFLGYKEELNKFMKISDCVLHSAFFEGLPNILIEARVAEIPIVCRYIEGVTSDIITNLNIGRQCMTESPEDFAGEVIKLIKEDNGRSATIKDEDERVNKFDIREVANQYINIIESLFQEEKKLNVLIVTSLFPPKYSGAVIQIIYVAKQLRKMGVDVEFITDNGNERTEEAAYEGFRIYKLKTYLRNKFCNKMADLIYVFRVLCHVVLRRKYGVILVISVDGLVSLLFPFLRLFGKKTILQLSLIGADDPLTMKRRKLGFLFYPSMRCIDKIIALSSKLFELSLEAGIDAKRMELIPNGVDTSRFYKMPDSDKMELKKNLGYSQYSHIFLAVGQVEERKRYEFMIKAWESINASFSDSVLLIIGPGSNIENIYFHRLNKIIEENSIRNIQFLGFKNNVYDFLRIADCVLHCAHFEGLPNILVEACVSRVPIVCRHIEGVTSDIIIDRNIGRQCMTESSEDFAREAIELIKEEKEQKIVNKKEEDIIKNFDIKEVANRYIGLFETLTRKEK
jgi:glycosyltransferase involved in cell wall biosynthesis